MVTHDDSTAASWPARRFDGRSSLAGPARLSVDRGWFSWWTDEPGATVHRLAVSDLGISDRFLGAPRRLALPDGSTLVVDDEDGRLDTALDAGGAPQPWPRRLTSTRLRIAACALALVLLVGWIDRHGAGMAAEAVVDALPRSIDAEIGERTLALIDGDLQPSQIDRDRQRRITRHFHEVADRLYPELKITVLFRSMPGVEGVNAFALPDGTIVLLDDLVAPMGDSEVMAVLGHELSHVVHRHSIQAMTRSVGLFTVFAAVLGDFSQVATGTLAGFSTLSYGREHEREADRDAVVFLRQAGLSPSAWPKALDTIASIMEARIGSRRHVPGWLSSHPGDEERAATATQLAR
jgi:Zn-dependent protease with chaperone function